MNSLSLSRHFLATYIYGNHGLIALGEVFNHGLRISIDSSLRSISQLQSRPISCAVNDSHSVENWLNHCPSNELLASSMVASCLYGGIESCKTPYFQRLLIEIAHS